MTNQIKGDGPECPSHTIKAPRSSVAAREYVVD